MSSSVSVDGPFVEMQNVKNKTDESVLEEGCEQSKYDHNLLESNFIFDSLSVQFHFIVFIKQFLAHTIIPFAFIFINYRGQGFIRNSIIPIYFNLVFPFFAYAMIISYFMCTNETQNVIKGAFWMPLIYFVQHKLTVALKYSSLSKKEYRKIQNCTNDARCDMFNNQMQLLSSWSNRDQKVLEFEIASAALRIGAKINEIYFNIPNFEKLQSDHAQQQQAQRDALHVEDNEDDISPEPLHGLESLKSNFYNWNAFVRVSKFTF